MDRDVASPASGLLLFASVMTLTLGVYAILRRRNARGAVAFALLMAAMSLDCFGSAFEISARTLERILFWVKVEYVGLSPLPAFWLILILQYTGRERTHPLLVVLLLALSATTLGIHLTNDIHHFYYRTTDLDLSGPFSVLVIGRGPWYYVQTGYLYASLLCGTILVIRMRISAGPATKRLTTAMLAGCLLPWLAAVLYFLGLTPWGMDFSALALAVSAPLYALAVLRFRLFDIVPVALDVVFRTMRDGVLIIDQEGRIADMNARAAEVLGEGAKLRPGSLVREALASQPEILKRVEQDTEGEDVRIEVGGEDRHFDLRASPVLDRRGRLAGRTIVLVDTTERARLLEEMRMLAIIDGLTGAYTRRHFQERARAELDRARRSGKPLSMVAIDLDDFKRINDGYGHAAGDAVLKAATSAWKSLLRSADLMGRLGGEEFVVLLPETPLDMAIAVAERLRISTEALALEHEGRPIRPTASFGVACAGKAADMSLDALLSRSDAALYQAKEAGRNTVKCEGAPEG